MARILVEKSNLKNVFMFPLATFDSDLEKVKNSILKNLLFSEVANRKIKRVHGRGLRLQGNIKHSRELVVIFVKDILKNWMTTHEKKIIRFTRK